MKRYTLALCMALGLTMSATAARGDAAAEVTPAELAGPTPAWVTDAGLGDTNVVPEMTLGEAAGEVRDRWADYRSSAEAAKRLALFALLAALANLMLTGIKNLGRLTSRGKRWLPWIAVGLGGLASTFTLLATAEPWPFAVLYGLGPVMSVVLHELGEKRGQPAGAG